MAYRCIDNTWCLDVANTLTVSHNLTSDTVRNCCGVGLSANLSDESDYCQDRRRQQNHNNQNKGDFL